MVRKVLVTGGELLNKGAQAMTFAVVGEVKNRYPDADVYLLSARDARRTEREQSNLKFEILPWDIRMKLRSFVLLRFFIKNKYFSPQQEKTMWLVVMDADLVIDVSGFCLSSQFPNLTVLNYLLGLYLFKKRKIPVILFPQSFGPFAFEGLLAPVLKKAIKHYLRYPALIYAREKQGEQMLNKIGVSRNVSTSLDSVIRLKPARPEVIWHEPPRFVVPEIVSGAVGIVPNQKIMTNNRGNDLYSLYCDMIGRLLSEGRHVYLLRHSFEDLEIIQNIKQLFLLESRVVVLGEDYDSKTLMNIISNFDFVIVSRYHALVHAYKCAVPALVLGWAVKYQELMLHFEQKNLCFDVRAKIDQAMITEQLLALSNDFSDASNRIRRIMKGAADGVLFEEALDSIEAR